MKRQNYGPHWGKLVHQLPGVVTWAYDLCLTIIVAHFEYLEDDVKRMLASPFWDIMVSLISLKMLLGPQNGSRSSRLEKLPEIVNCATIKEPKKLKEIVLESKWNRQVATNIQLDRQPL